MEGRTEREGTIITVDELRAIRGIQEQILNRINGLEQAVINNTRMQGVQPEYISAKQFMDAVNIKRWKFDQLISHNKIRTLKKKRKIYVLPSEVKRFFADPSIQ